MISTPLSELVLVFSAQSEERQPWRQVLQGLQEGNQVLLFPGRQLELLYKVEIFHRILKREAPAVVQIGRGVFDTSQGKGLIARRGHHHAIG